MQRGFSLVELSIVLVILGLLTGGILAGQSLIRAAELRAVSTEFSRHVAAVQSFRDKYFAIPGDMTNATTFWGAAHATPSTCVTTIGTGTQTCNGDGNGWITPITGSEEHFRFWQHLANAGLIEGSYQGVHVGSDNLGSTSANVPRSKLGQGLWFTYQYGQTGNSQAFNSNYGNAFELGAQSASPHQHPYFPLAKAEEVWNVDVKMDDGKPATGRLLVRAYNGLSTCSTTAANDPSNMAADYLLSSSTVNCGFVFARAYN